jgi:hypothetical protein
VVDVKQAYTKENSHGTTTLFQLVDVSYHRGADTHPTTGAKCLDDTPDE